MTLMLGNIEGRTRRERQSMRSLDQHSFPRGSDGKESACNAGDLSLITELGRSSGEENGHLLLYSCLENPMDRGVWQATVHEVAKNPT